MLTNATVIPTQEEISFASNSPLLRKYIVSYPRSAAAHWRLLWLILFYQCGNKMILTCHLFIGKKKYSSDRVTYAFQ